MGSKAQLAALIKGKDHKIIGPYVVITGEREHQICSRSGMILGYVPAGLWTDAGNDVDKIKKFMRAPDANMEDTPEEKKPVKEEKEEKHDRKKR